MNKQLLLSIILLLTTAFAASADAPVVDRAEQQISQAPSLTVNFRINGADGRLVMCGECFTLEVPGMRTAFNGTTQWTLNEEDSELTITTPTAEEVAAINPLGFISTLRSQFTSTTLPDGRVRFTPVARGSEISEIVATFNQATSMPTIISMKAAGNREMLIDAIKVTRGAKPIATSKFAIKPDKNIIITDLR